MIRKAITHVLARTAHALQALGAKPRPPNIEEELARLDRAIHRGDSQLAQLVMKSSFRPDVDCCPSCTVPGYAEQLEVIARTKQWRDVLASKIRRAQVSVAKASPNA